MSKWKQLQLVSPRRYFKYNFRNLSGDAEGVFIGNPSSFTQAPKAVKDLWQAFTGEKRMTPELREWFERGGMESTLQAQELGELKTLETFIGKYQKKNNVTEIPGKVWKEYWKKAKVSTDFREAILRYASYLDYKKQMTQNPDGKPNNYGASLPGEVMGLSNINDRAFMLSNDLLGDTNCNCFHLDNTLDIVLNKSCLWSIFLLRLSKVDATSSLQQILFFYHQLPTLLLYLFQIIPCPLMFPYIDLQLISMKHLLLNKIHYHLLVAI